jgi:hypothetical protein
MIIKRILVLFSVLLFNCTGNENQRQLDLLEEKINSLNFDKNDNAITLLNQDNKPILQIISDSNTFYQIKEFIEKNNINNSKPYRYFISIPFVKPEEYESILYIVSKFFKIDQIYVSDDKTFFKIYYDYSEFNKIFLFCRDFLNNKIFIIEYQNMKDYQNENETKQKFELGDSSKIQKKFG